MYFNEYFPTGYFSNYFGLQLEIVFSAGKVSYATFRYFESTAKTRVKIDIALEPAIVDDIVSGVVYDSKTIKLKFDDFVQEKSFIDIAKAMVLNSATPISKNAVATVRNTISKSQRRK